MKFTDEDLLQKYSAGDTDAEAELIKRHQDWAAIIARSFPIPNVEYADIRQEAIIGLLRAVRTWTPYGGASFKTFARRLIQKALIDLYRKATRCSEVPARLRASLDDVLQSDGDDVPLIEAIPGGDTANEDVDSEDSMRAMKESVHDLYWLIIHDLMGGDLVVDVAEEHGITVETVMRIIASLKLVAEQHKSKQSQLVLDILDATSSQPGLFSQGVEVGTLDSTDAAEAMFERIKEFQTAIFSDIEAGYEPSEIATRRGISMTALSGMIRLDHDEALAA